MMKFYNRHSSHPCNYEEGKSKLYLIDFKFLVINIQKKRIASPGYRIAEYNQFSAERTSNILSQKGVPPNRPRSIVEAVLIYNTIKTHGKTVDAILVINWGTSCSRGRHHSWHWVFMCSYKLFVLIVAFCFAVNCFLFASWSEILIGIFRSCW